jgi:Undecaprenyl-phosphate glucose phosphotransferase
MSANAERAALRQRLSSELPSSSYVAPSVLAALVGVLEGLVTAFGGILVQSQYPGFGSDIPTDVYFTVVAIVAALYVFSLEFMGQYKLSSLLNPVPALGRVAGAWLMVFALLVVGVFISKAGDSISRAWLMIWFGSGLCFAVAARFLVGGALQLWNKQGQFDRRAVIVGGGSAVANAVSVLKSSGNMGLSIVGFFDDREDQRSPAEVSGIKKLGAIADLVTFVRKTRIDLVIITIPPTAETRLLSILSRLWILPVDIKISAVDQKIRYRPRAYSYIGNLPCLDVFDRPLGDWGPFLKSLEDKLIAALALIALSPVFAAVAAAVRLDSRGPVFFKQKRYGFNNELIEVYKFRSMKVDATDAHAAKLVVKGDPRVTRVGRFIRRTSLDELPQLINVLKGELSLVGPRPHATKAKAGDQLYEHVVDGYFARHKVRPGITGWAQINGWRGETDTPEKIQNRVQYDLDYIENWSLTFDLYILAKTPLALLSTENAY